MLLEQKFTFEIIHLYKHIIVSKPSQVLNELLINYKLLLSL